MIGSLRGTLSEIVTIGDLNVEILVEVGGVGYRVTIGTRHAAELGPVGSEIALAVHTHVREGAISLFGFPSPIERRTFEVLTTTHGVGPALALAILATHSPFALARAIAEQDTDALVCVPGVGRKTAQRLIVELGQRLDDLTGSASELPGIAGTRPAVHHEVRDALTTLGYGVDEVRGALNALPDDGSVEELLREALRELAPHP